jgi:hypothetical protein
MAGGTVGSSYLFYLQLVDENGIQFTDTPQDMPAESPFITILNVDPSLVRKLKPP